MERLRVCRILTSIVLLLTLTQGKYWISIQDYLPHQLNKMLLLTSNQRIGREHSLMPLLTLLLLRIMLTTRTLSMLLRLGEFILKIWLPGHKTLLAVQHYMEVPLGILRRVFT